MRRHGFGLLLSQSVNVLTLVALAPLLSQTAHGWSATLIDQLGIVCMAHAIRMHDEVKPLRVR